MNNIVDLFIIGGGINGAGIARDAAGRGLSVVLCEKDDLAQATSSHSGKLIHGGLRYLEYYDFKLVRKALIEREVLLNSACHIIWPMRFVIPHSPMHRPAWLLRLGLFLYDHLGSRKQLLATRTLNLLRDPQGLVIKDHYHKGFEYSDCWVDDARLVILNALDAAKHGAKILTRMTCKSVKRSDKYWIVEISDTVNSTKQTLYAKAIVNAAGPWVNHVINNVAKSKSKRKVRLVKGSHIIVAKFWQGRQAYLIQNHDKRVIFVNPYGKDKALIGTTDISYTGAPETVCADESEVIYLINAVNNYFKSTLSVNDVIDKFSGVRPLYDDGCDNPSAVTRDYILDLDETAGLPILNIFGGKITTFRKLAEHALEILKLYFPNAQKQWTASSSLPGGDIKNADFQQFFNTFHNQFPWLPQDLAWHYCRLYGTCAYQILGTAQCLQQLGKQFASQLFEAEVRYLYNFEWAKTTEDILKRRTKHYLTMDTVAIKNFDKWFKNFKITEINFNHKQL